MLRADPPLSIAQRNRAALELLLLNTSVHCVLSCRGQLTRTKIPNHRPASYTQPRCLPPFNTPTLHGCPDRAD